MKSLILAVVVLPFGLSLSGCAEPATSGPAPAPSSTAVTHVMPDDYPNFAETCDGHGHRVFTFAWSDLPAVVIEDLTCPKA